MTRALWILAIVTLAVQAALGVFGAAVERALLAANWPPRLSYTTINLTLDALLILTAGAGIYAAGQAHRGGWVALFGAALVLGLYGPTAAVVAVPHLSLGFAVVTYLRILDVALELLVPVVALAYALRYRPARGAPAGAT